MPLLVDGQGKALTDFISDGDPAEDARHDQGDHNHDSHRDENKGDDQKDQGKGGHNEGQQAQPTRRQRLRDHSMRHPTCMRCQEKHHQHGQNSQTQCLSEGINYSQEWIEIKIDAGNHRRRRSHDRRYGVLAIDATPHPGCGSVVDLSIYL